MYRLVAPPLQIVKPAPGATSWEEQLAKDGPSIHNVTLMVQDLERVRGELVGRGCREILRFDVQIQNAGLPVEGEQRAYLIDAMAQLGLRLELMDSIPGWTPGEEA